MELSSSNIKKLFIFRQNKSFLIFRETKTSKKILLILRKSRKTSDISVGNFPSTKMSYFSGN